MLFSWEKLLTQRCTTRPHVNTAAFKIRRDLAATSWLQYKTHPATCLIAGMPAGQPNPHLRFRSHEKNNNNGGNTYNENPSTKALHHSHHCSVSICSKTPSLASIIVVPVACVYSYVVLLHGYVEQEHVKIHIHTYIYMANVAKKKTMRLRPNNVAEKKRLRKFWKIGILRAVAPRRRPPSRWEARASVAFFGRSTRAHRTKKIYWYVYPKKNKSELSLPLLYFCTYGMVLLSLTVLLFLWIYRYRATLCWTELHGAFSLHIDALTSLIIPSSAESITQKREGGEEMPFERINQEKKKKRKNSKHVSYHHIYIPTWYILRILRT